MSKLFKCLTILTSVTVFALSSATALALEVGNPAPDFSLASTQSSTTTLHQFHGKPVVLVFYPADQTPGCTFQLCSLRDHYAEFQKAGAAILASNPGDLKSHRTFAARQHYPFPLLVDANGKMAKATGWMVCLASTSALFLLLMAMAWSALWKAACPARKNCWAWLNRFIKAIGDLLKTVILEHWAVSIFFRTCLFPNKKLNGLPCA